MRLDPELGFGYRGDQFWARHFEGLTIRADLQAAKTRGRTEPQRPDSMMALAKAQVRFGDHPDAVANGSGRAACTHGTGNLRLCAWSGRFTPMAAAKRRPRSSAMCLVRAPRDANCLLIQAALQGGSGELAKAQATMGRSA